jgi:hypothetical protein
MAAPPRACLLRRAAPPLLPSIKSEPSDSNPAAQNDQYPVAGPFAKETRPFYNLCLQSLAEIQNTIFIDLYKSENSSVYLQNCHCSKTLIKSSF